MGPARPVRYHTLAEYRHDVTATAVAFRQIKRSPDNPHSSPSPYSFLHHPTLPSIRYSIPTQGASGIATPIFRILIPSEPRLDLVIYSETENELHLVLDAVVIN
ncbi:hypothetical protein EVAR_79230_1 [Eumeta japonica]|uniref:Uncharacterized protein n=1 Tax=Eumeta variegata TaxID=151549 RepID=A0A4C1Z8B1_EUMVA|nr:hypothetical protein EVAR_79230_1 [Eumeta japonica]